MQTLDRITIQQELMALNGISEITWALENNAIVAEFCFDNFMTAFAFMTKIAMLSEKHNHHPDWSNSYDLVTISLTTHQAQGLTNKDFTLATEITLLLNF